MVTALLCDYGTQNLLGAKYHFGKRTRMSRLREAATATGRDYLINNPGSFPAFCTRCGIGFLTRKVTGKQALTARFPKGLPRR